MALEDLPDDVCSSFLDGYCWADPPEDEREDLATALARQPNCRAFQHGLELDYVSTEWSAAVTQDEFDDWSQAAEEVVRYVNAEYGRIATFDEESGTARLVYTNDDPG
ncbi:hypothetical protein [Nocardioides aequoreus]|uniref:hypothetical protein n=1 Tax=Nocardioides aequoreus TaxID=397278 RepID=UPI0004C30CD7|nr:hypothetical protein [Nocardioides aequoreus]